MRLIWLWLGILIGDLATAVLFLGVQHWVERSEGLSGPVLAVPSLLLVPVFGGLVASWFWRRLDLTVGGCLGHSFTMTLLGIAGAAVFLGEGTVCLVIAAPGLYVMLTTGSLLGRLLFRPRDNGLRLVMLPLLGVLAHAEAQLRADQQEMETTNGGDRVGTDRHCIFSDGIVIMERISEFVPRERLTFDVVEQPPHPESYGHVTLHRGQFVLRDNRDGTTTLIGTSWYTLHVHPLWYFDLWTRDMTRQVHLRVMRHVRRLSES